MQPRVSPLFSPLLVGLLLLPGVSSHVGSGKLAVLCSWHHRYPGLIVGQ